MGFGMAQNGMVKAVWDECGTAHAVVGSILKEDDQFIEIVLSDGTDLRISKSRIIKVERPGRGGH
jgi:preprotein translocase subunit YajC